MFLPYLKAMVTVFWEVLVAMHATGLELLLQIPLHLKISDIIDTITKPTIISLLVKGMISSQSSLLSPPEMDEVRFLVSE